MKDELASHTRAPDSVPARRQIVGLDVLRVLSACYVVLWHLACVDWVPQLNSGREITHALDFMKSFAAYGWIGVQIFFVLSGFVIAYSVQRVSASNFAVHRFARLWPTAAVSLTLCLIIIECKSGREDQIAIVTKYITSLLFSPFNAPLEGSFWTLPVECIFYGVVLLVLWRKSVTRLPAVMALVGCVSTSYWILLTFVEQANMAHTSLLFRILRQIYGRNYTLIPHGCYFATGVLLWEMLMRRTTPAWIASLTIAIVGGVLEVRFHTERTAEFLSLRLPWSIGVAIWLAGLAMIVASTSLNENIYAVLGQNALRAIRTAALLTYPMYLLNERVGKELMLATAPNIGFRWALMLAGLCIVLVSYVVAAIIDPYIQHRLKPYLGVRETSR